MALKIRLQRQGKKGKPFYRIVVADSRARRDGKFIELLGNYNPTTVPAQINLDVDRSVYWLQVGAEATETVQAILSYKGALYKKHLLRGVSKGSFTLEVAEEKFAEWLASKEGKVMDHIARHEATKEERHKAIVAAGKERAEARLKKNEVVAVPAAEESVEEAAPESSEVQEVAEAAVEAVENQVSEPAQEVVAEAESAVEAAEEQVAEVAAEAEQVVEAAAEVVEEQVSEPAQELASAEENTEEKTEA